MSRRAKSKTVLKLTIDQQERLISLVQENRLLYDESCHDYKNQAMAASTWVKIATELDVAGLDWQQCKRKWQNIEDYFNATRKMSKDTHQNETEGGSSAKGQFYKRLQFLLVQYTEEASVGNSGCPTSSNSKGKATSTSDSDSDSIYIESGSEVIDDDEDSNDNDIKVKAEIEGGPTQEEKTFHTEGTDNGNFIKSSIAQDSETKPQRKRFHTGSPPVSPPPIRRSRLKKKDKRLKGKKNMSSFYLMMREKMSDFPEKDQISMEDQIWKLYMQLVEKRRQTDTDNP